MSSYWKIPCSLEHYNLFFFLLQCSIPSFSKILFIFQSNTMLIAWIWLEGIGKFPPHPSAKKIEFPTRGFAARGKFFFLPRDLEGIFQYLLAISKPLYHCNTVKNKS